MRRRHGARALAWQAPPAAAGSRFRLPACPRHAAAARRHGRRRAALTRPAPPPTSRACPGECRGPASCPGGGIGRRTSFRCWRSQGRGGSSPLLGTTIAGPARSAGQRCQGDIVEAIVTAARSAAWPCPGDIAEKIVAAPSGNDVREPSLSRSSRRGRPTAGRMALMAARPMPIARPFTASSTRAARKAPALNPGVRNRPMERPRPGQREIGG